MSEQSDYCWLFSIVGNEINKAKVYKKAIILKYKSNTVGVAFIY
jgi:hypothetical protein